MIKIRYWPLIALGLLPLPNFAQETMMASSYLAVGMLGVSLITAHYLAPTSYDWTQNTISELGAQNYQHAWVMRAGLVSFGTLIGGSALWRLNENNWMQMLPLAIYGASMAVTGFFSAPPFEKGVRFSAKEAATHSLFANLAGFALTTAILATAATCPDPQVQKLHYTASAFVLASSLLFKINPTYQGVWQRVLWTGSLGWIGWTFSF